MIIMKTFTIMMIVPMLEILVMIAMIKILKIIEIMIMATKILQSSLIEKK